MPARDVREQLTVFVPTVGDRENFEDCMAHLSRQTVDFQLEIIDRVAPMSASFQEMNLRCRTPYYVQVDEDMLLAPYAIEALYEAMERAESQTAIVSGLLWDVDSSRPIHGVKIYRHRIVRRFPYTPALGCDIAQLEQLKAGGYTIKFLPGGGRCGCLGEHGKHYTPRTIFIRWQRLLQKHRRYRSLGWAQRMGPFLLQRYLRSRDPIHLYALLGAVAGTIGAEMPDREANYREENLEYLSLVDLIGLPEGQGDQLKNGQTLRGTDVTPHDR